MYVYEEHVYKSLKTHVCCNVNQSRVGGGGGSYDHTDATFPVSLRGAGGAGHSLPPLCQQPCAVQTSTHSSSSLRPVFSSLRSQDFTFVLKVKLGK